MRKTEAWEHLKTQGHINIFKDESGVSVVVGVLLLTMVVITSVSAFALMTSQAQKKEMERQSHLQAVESEKLKIFSLELKGNGYWDNVAVDIVNLNTEGSIISSIGINGRTAANYTDGEKTYDYVNRLILPPAGSKKLFLNFTANFTSPLNISSSQPIKILIFTALTNEFEEVFLPPVPIIKVSAESQNINGAYSDVLVLDGGNSIHYEGTIVSYQWQVANGSWSTNLTGQQARIIFNQSETGPFWVNLTVKDSNGMVNSGRWYSP